MEPLVPNHCRAHTTAVNLFLINRLYFLEWFWVYTELLRPHRVVRLLPPLLTASSVFTSCTDVVPLSQMMDQSWHMIN